MSKSYQRLPLLGAMLVLSLLVSCSGSGLGDVLGKWKVDIPKTSELKEAPRDLDPWRDALYEITDDAIFVTKGGERKKGFYRYVGTEEGVVEIESQVDGRTETMKFKPRDDGSMLLTFATRKAVVIVRDE